MLHSNSNTTYTTTESPESSTRVRRLRLTLRPEGSSASAPHEPKRNGTTETGECRIAGNERRHNVYFSSEQNSAERAEQPTLHLSNGLAASPRGKVYGLVKRTDPNNSEVLVYEWSVNQLKEEMKYIKEVRTSLETVRQKIFSDSNEMNHRIKYLTKEMKKSLLSATLEGNKSREEIENLRASYRQSLDQIKEKDQYLQEAQAENQILQLKVESSQEANASVMRDMTRKLYDQYEAKMKEVEQKHQAEKETIQARINQTLQKLEDVTKRAEEAEMMLKERDQKIEEMDQFIVRMEKERHFLRQRLQEQEQQLHDQQLQQRDELDSKLSERSQRLEEETASLRERIRHLDNMVHCQQKKVKHMIEESQSLKKQIREKDVLIDELMDRISLLEAENNELQDNLAYLKSLSQQQAEKIREQAVSYDFPTSQTSETRRIKITSPYLKLMELSMHR
uniref:Myocardial zonula adherens protein-like n=2 Tax=Callorhinchus milii TaxID=7868 RepID=A0A4W3KKY2_CALMI